MKRRMDSGKEQLEKMLEGWRGSDRQKHEEGRRAAFESETPDERRCRNETQEAAWGRGGEGNMAGVSVGGAGVESLPFTAPARPAQTQ